MHRKTFIQSIIGLTAMTTLGSYKTLFNSLEEQEELMPVLFLGHGSPMNAIEDNEFTQGWERIGRTIPKPKAILMVSAHWETKGTKVTAALQPRTIHDFGGFPQALFDVQYPAPGSEWLANETKEIMDAPVELDHEWGFDHGCWSVLRKFYPDADIPVVQLSLDYTKDAGYHYDLAKQLKALRKKGVLIVGSGNMVHNFSYAKVKGGTFNFHFGHEWALNANEQFKELISKNDFKSLINYKTYSQELNLSAPTPEHYLPMLYAMALKESKEEVQFFNDALIAGSFSMTSLMIS